MFDHFYVLLIISVWLFASIKADYFEECDGVDQDYIPVQEDCSYFIFCHGEDSFKDACPDDSPYFSIEDQTCEFNRNVCGDRPFPDGDFSTEIEETSTEVTTNTPTTISTSVSVSMPTVVVTTSGSIASSSISSSSSTSSSVVQITTTPFAPSAIPYSCPAIDDPNKAIFLSHPKSCSDYFLCYHGERLPMRCSNMLHFDVRQQKCDYPEKVKCQVMDIASPREQCMSHTYDLYPHPDNCNYYYQCALGYLRVMQCPINMGWHYEKRACVLRPYAKCYNRLK